jgi:hypothetical protein
MKTVKILNGEYKDYHGLLEGYVADKGKIIILGVLTKPVFIEVSDFEVVNV